MQTEVSSSNLLKNSCIPPSMQRMQKYSQVCKKGSQSHHSKSVYSIVKNGSTWAGV